MSKVYSVRLQNDNVDFINNLKSDGLIPTKVINNAISIYKKYLIKKELMREASLETDEDRKESMQDFDLYKTIVEQDEAI